VALTVFKTVRDPTTSGWVGSIPMHSRQPARVARDCGLASHNGPMRNVKLTRVYLSMVFAAACLPSLLVAQQSGVARPAATSTAPATAAPSPIAAVDSFTPPISPGRAFLYSFLIPGSAQSILGRHKAGAGFVFVEAVTLGMIRESAADVHEARRLKGDSTVISYVDANGNPLVFKTPRQFGDAYIQAREAHVEDWIALLVANHLFAAADGFVAAHLWDVRARLAMRAVPNGGTALALSVSW